MLNAIQAGDSAAAIFFDSNCHLYLLHLMEKKTVPFLQGMTIYSYLMALMQFTDKQALCSNDNDGKTIRDLSIEVISNDKKLTVVGEKFIKGIICNLEKIEFSLSYEDVAQYILSLPASEQWLTKITFADDYDKKKMSDCDRLAGTLLTNLSFTMKSVGSNSITGYIPSVSIIDYILHKISTKPLEMKFCFGTIGKDTLYKMHEKNMHPVALYNTHVKSNLKSADNYSPGSYLIWLHDIGHVFWGSMLSSQERSFIFNQYIPLLKELITEADNVKDDEVIQKLQGALDKVVDFDLTDIRGFSNTNSRLKEYIMRSLGQGVNGLYGYCKVEYKRLGRCVEDRIYYLLNKYACKEKYDFISTIMLPWISKGQFHRETSVTDALELLGNGKSIMRWQSQWYDYADIDWKLLLSALENSKDSKDLWEKLCPTSNEYSKLGSVLYLLIIKQGLKFFHPYLPLSLDDIKNLASFARDKVSGHIDSSKKWNDYQMGKDKEMTDVVVSKSTFVKL